VITNSNLTHAYLDIGVISIPQRLINTALQDKKMSGDGLSVTPFTHFITKANVCQRNSTEHNNEDVLTRLSGEVKSYLAVHFTELRN
jgi:hypothetical protein